MMHPPSPISARSSARLSTIRVKMRVLLRLSAPQIYLDAGAREAPPGSLGPRLCGEGRGSEPEFEVTRVNSAHHPAEKKVSLPCECAPRNHFGLPSAIIASSMSRLHFLHGPVRRSVQLLSD